MLAASTSRGDTLELLSGAKVTGDILTRSDTAIEMNVTIGKIKFKRSYPLATVHAISRGTTRIVINAKDGAAPAASPNAAASNPAKAPVTSGKAMAKAGGGSRSQLDALIDDVGRTPPDWFDATKLNYPASLDLSWPEPAPGGWNAQKNMGQFIWDIINPNPNRWREGIRLMHHLLEVNKDNPRVVHRTMLSIGRMYHNLLEDYARSAFWFRAAGVEKTPDKFLGESVTLAECYWRLGYRNEALALLAKAPGSYPKAKLLADMGEVDRAIQLASAGASQNPDTAYLVCGDACRIAGRYREAVQYYERVLATPLPPKAHNRHVKNRNRAAANIEAVKLFDSFDLSRIADGTYAGSSQGYEGQVEVAVDVRGNKIVAVKVTDHKEKQFYSAISDTPRKIIAKQSVKGVDATSHATITSDAIINATAKAIAKGGG